MTTRIPILMLSLLASLAAWAGPGSRGERSRESEAAESARRETGGGRVLSVKPSDGGYKVKVLTPKGEVRYVPVDDRERSRERNR